MASISQIKMTDGTVYNIKDENAANIIVRSDEDIVTGTTKLQIGSSSETVNLVTKDEADAAYLPLTGGTLTGDFYVNTKNAGTEAQIFLRSAAGNLYLFDTATKTGSKGVIASNAAGTSTNVIVIDQDNNATFYGDADGLTDDAKSSVASDIYTLLMTGEW